MADEWNEKDFEIKGNINSLDIVKFDNNKVTTIEKLYLK